MKREPLVSIVVPIYNLEKFLDKNIKSLINQRYKNIEIILVDDGSPDNSAKICDEYAKKDKRIKVIHKVNEGVSKARNTGIDNSIGDYICFVDGDDFLANDFIEYMLDLINKTNSDFALSKNCFKYNISKEMNQIDEDDIEIYSPADATALLISQRVEVGCWNKIYSKKLLDKYNIRFNDKQFYGEGLLFITTVAQHSKCVGVGNRKVYYYRKDNINSATTKYNSDKFSNGLNSLKIIERNLIIKDKSIEEQLNIHYCMFLKNAIYDTYLHNEHLNNQEKLNYWKNELRKYMKIVFRYNSVSFKSKLAIALVQYSPFLYLWLKKLKIKF